MDCLRETLSHQLIELKKLRICACLHDLCCVFATDFISRAKKLILRTVKVAKAVFFFSSVSAVLGPHRQFRKEDRLNSGCSIPTKCIKLECFAQAYWLGLLTVCDTLSANCRWFVCLDGVKQINAQRDANQSTLDHRCYQTCLRSAHCV